MKFLASLALGLLCVVGHSNASSEARSPIEAAATPALSQAERTLILSLDWLAAHQGLSGGWSAGKFDRGCQDEKIPCEGFGQPDVDIGVSGLALLAFLRSGDLLDKKSHADVVPRAVAYLLKHVDKKTGLIGEAEFQNSIYNHIVALLALCEAQLSEPDEEVLAACKGGLKYMLRGRNPYDGWHYAVPGNGEVDGSVTGLAMQVLLRSKELGLEVKSRHFDGGASAIATLTNRATGRIAYSDKVDTSSRYTFNSYFPVEVSEAVTALGLKYSLKVLPEEGSRKSYIKNYSKSLDILMKAAPVWEKKAHGKDAYYWMHGTEAMALAGGKYWSKWKRAMIKAAVAGQQKKGHPKGSWDPEGPWGWTGGRVYSTACLSIALTYCR